MVSSGEAMAVAVLPAATPIRFAPWSIPSQQPIGEAFQKLCEFTGESPATLTRLLYETHNVGMTWYVFAVVGVISAFMIYLYGRWILTLARKEKNA